MINTKQCIKCNRVLDIRKFEFRSDTQKLRNVCRKCHKGYEETIELKRERILELFNNGLKQCGRCKEIKDISEFHVDRQTLTGRTSYCKKCVKEKNADKDVKQRASDARLKSLYKLTDEQVKRHNSIDKCETCGNDLIKKVCDHDHKTGLYRGTLCWVCNVGLGHFNDCIESLKNAIKYLKER